jgi:tetratricopeptide (TPR) repeat protein
MPDGERREKETVRDARLTTAGTVFEQVRRNLELRKHRTSLEDLYLRNSYYYLGACAFDLRNYQAAIAHYDAARERYPKDPASLVAMVQVVSCYLAEGDVAKANLANQRAQRFFESIPPSAWEDANLPMTRQDWQHWLNAKDELRRATQGSADAAVPSE